MSVLIGERSGEGQPQDEQCSRRNCCNSHGFSSTWTEQRACRGPAACRGHHFEAVAHKIDPW